MESQSDHREDGLGRALCGLQARLSACADSLETDTRDAEEKPRCRPCARLHHRGIAHRTSLRVSGSLCHRHASARACRVGELRAWVQASSRESDLQQMQQYSQQLGSNLAGLEDRLKADRSRQAAADQRECPGGHAVSLTSFKLGLHCNASVCFGSALAGMVYVTSVNFKEVQPAGVKRDFQRVVCHDIMDDSWLSATDTYLHCWHPQTVMQLDVASGHAMACFVPEDIP